MNLIEKGKMQVEPLYTITEASRLLRTSRVSIYKWIKNGKLKAIDINGFTRIKESEIKRLLGEN